MLAQFIRLAVEDAAEASDLKESLEQAGARVWSDDDVLHVLWADPDVGRISNRLDQNARSVITVLEERSVEVADELLGVRRRTASDEVANPVEERRSLRQSRSANADARS